FIDGRSSFTAAPRLNPAARKICIPMLGAELWSKGRSYCGSAHSYDLGGKWRVTVVRLDTGSPLEWPVLPPNRPFAIPVEIGSVGGKRPSKRCETQPFCKGDGVAVLAGPADARWGSAGQITTRMHARSRWQ